MEKTRDLFKKIRDTKAIFHAKMGSIKDRNGLDLQKQKILTCLGTHVRIKDFKIKKKKERKRKKKKEEVARIHRRTVQKRSSRPR